MTPEKCVLKKEWWDGMFAPTSCLTLVTTVDRDGRPNAAALGSCVRVAHEPMFIAFTATLGKDTIRNVEQTGEFVINIVPFEADMLAKVMICGIPFKPGVSEIERAGLTALPATLLRPPRIAECHVHFECRVEWTHDWIDRRMVCARVVAASATRGSFTDEGRIVWDVVKPAHFCGGGYRDHFVPAYDRPFRPDWSFEPLPEELHPRN